MKYDRTIIGYHGRDSAVADDLIARSGLPSSRKGAASSTSLQSWAR